MWVYSFPFSGASGNKDTLPMQGVFSFLSPGAKATLVWIMPAAQVAAQELVMSVIGTKGRVRTVSTSLPPHSSKMKPVYPSPHSWNSLKGYRSVLQTGVILWKIFSPLKSKNKKKKHTLKSRQEWLVFWRAMWFTSITWFSSQRCVGYFFVSFCCFFLKKTIMASKA